MPGVTHVTPLGCKHNPESGWQEGKQLDQPQDPALPKFHSNPPTLGPKYGRPDDCKLIRRLKLEKWMGALIVISTTLPNSYYSTSLLYEGKLAENESFCSCHKFMGRLQITESGTTVPKRAFADS